MTFAAIWSDAVKQSGIIDKTAAGKAACEMFLDMAKSGMTTATVESIQEQCKNPLAIYNQWAQINDPFA